MRSSNNYTRSLTLNLYKSIKKDRIKRSGSSDNYHDTPVKKTSWLNLHAAASHGDLEGVKYFTEKQVQSINTKDKLGQTPLYTAAYNGHLHLVKYLVNNGAELNIENKLGDTPLHAAASQAYLEITQYFIEEKDQSINSKNGSGWTLLHSAAFNGRLNIVAYLIRKGADLNAENQLDLNFLNSVALNAHFSVISYLVDVKNIKIGNLFEAAEKGYLGLVKYFIEEKCEDINTKDKLGQTPLYTAAYNGHLHLVKYLVNNGAELNIENKLGDTPLHAAASQAYLEITQYFIEEEDQSINSKNGSGWTLLHSAAFNGRLNIVAYLIRKGANLAAKDDLGDIPLHTAISNAEPVDLELIKYLVEQGSDVNAKNGAGNTPLHQAAQNGYLEVVKYLAGKASDLNVKNNLGDSPLRSAALNDHTDIATYLASKGAARSRRSFQIEDKTLVIATEKGAYITSDASRPFSWINNFVNIFKNIPPFISSSSNIALATPDINHAQLGSDEVKADLFNGNSTLLLCDLIIRKITGKKHDGFFTPSENKILEAGDRIINSINTFESMLETKQFNNSFKF